MTSNPKRCVPFVPSLTLLVVIPIAMGASTTCIVLIAIPAASTGTTVPSMDLHRTGVMKMAPRVVAVVMRTERATLPFAM